MTIEVRENLRRLMMRAGIASIKKLADECAKIVPPRVGATKRDAMSVGMNLIASMLSGRSKSISFDQITILCKTLNCTPNHLFGFEPIPGFEKAQTDKVERLETQVGKLTDALKELAKRDDPLGKQIAEILKQS